MFTIFGAGATFIGMAICEKRGWLDLDYEKVETIIKIGMGAGITGSLLYFILKLSGMFL
ncbi:hypothetical protein WKH56_27525 [Priestia sp. SB1]|uniref:hypothetical protein n=1 Tax=Priestia sp. SB1 TaxID=3132359 RepID=UPI00317CCE1E